MAKHTGPLLGYNNNISYRGNVYHLQTEDSGTRRPHVITHLFADGGRVVKSAKTTYAQLVDDTDVADKVRAIMKSQHKAMAIALRDGELDALLEPTPPASPQEGDRQELVEQRQAPDASGVVAVAAKLEQASTTATWHTPSAVAGDATPTPVQVDAGQSEAAAGQSEAAAGQSEAAAGQSEAAAGQSEDVPFVFGARFDSGRRLDELIIDVLHAKGGPGQ